MKPLKQIVKQFIPQAIYQPILRWWQKPQPVHWGNLRRLTPISHIFGFDRGLPIDRYYIERFLSNYELDVRGHVLEIGDNTYTRKFGGGRVIKSDILHAVRNATQAAIVADLTSAEHIPSEAFDCIICTQTLQFIYDMRTAIQTLYRILKPGGVLLSTISGISQISRYDMDRWGDFWRLTSRSSLRLFKEIFPDENIKIEAYGNVLVAMAFLQGMATLELKKNELDFHDPDYEVLITVKAIKQ